jgi:SAM-dependent methyltransferase
VGGEASFTHPRFARVYGAVAATGERLGYGRWRRSVLAPAAGRLLVLGLGPGHDLAHLPAAVTSVVAVEPDPLMRAAALPRVAACPVPVALVSADAQALPLADGSVDAVLCACVLCSVASPPRALAEVRRVLAPGGVLLLLEHVAAPQGHWLAAVQHLVRPVWGRAAGGCSVRRDTLGEVAAAGFDTAGVRSVVVRSNLPPVAPHVVGAAVPLGVEERDAA